MIPPGNTLAGRFLLPFFEFVFPPVCFVCGERCPNHESVLCPACWRSMSRTSPGDAHFRHILALLQEDGLIDGLISHFYFDKEGALQSLIHDLKYGGMTRIGTELGNVLGGAVLERLRSERVSGLVPVPLHRAKFRERGYNQSTIICRAVSGVTGIPVMARLLKRCRYTETQTNLGVEKRRENVLGAFEPVRTSIGDIRGGTFLLVDDVITTGSTIRECAGVLRRNGADRVFAGSLALAR